jgi:hypothetical protein
MRIFIGYGYNERDQWIETDVFPILEAMNLEIVHGKDMHGDVLQDGVKERIENSDGLIGFSTLREGQKKADFASHIWVRDEMSHALALKKRVVEVREKGVNIGEGLVGDRQRVELDPKNRLRCIAELVKVVNGWSMRRLLLVPKDTDVGRRIHRAIVKDELLISYRCRTGNTISRPKEGRIEKINSGLYLNAIGLPDNSLVEIQGSTRAEGVLFNTGWAAADLVRIEFD